MLGLRTTIYKVGDLNKAKEWYAKAFSLSPYFDEPYYVGFNVGGYELGLIPQERSYVEKSDNILAYWGVDDIQQAYKHLVSIGGQEYEPPHSVGGPLMVAGVLDPWGNVLGIIYNPAFKLS